LPEASETNALEAVKSEDVIVVAAPVIVACFPFHVDFSVSVTNLYDAV
jgi:hypothetical protein